MTRKRLALLLALAASAAALAQGVSPAPRLAWIATAHQQGPVGYRDPAGGVSPDGRWIAYSEGRFLRVRPVAGGGVMEFPPGAAQIRSLAWSPDSTTILADGNSTPGSWGVYDLAAATRRPLWPARPETGGFRQLAWAPDGRSIAAIGTGRDGLELLTIAADGGAVEAKSIAARIAFPSWTPKREIACITTVNGKPRVTVPCGGPALAAHPAADAYGPIAFSPDGGVVYVSLANDRGTVDLWAIPTGQGDARQLTFFDRDTYAPTVASDGSVVFKVQSYRTHVAMSASGGGPTEPLATLPSETPSWDPTGKWLGITYGTWRRQPDDAKYPDIAQDAGIIAVDPAHPAAVPSSVVHASESEDQSLCWSPDGEWIAFHSHKDMSDDIWLRRAAGDPTARRITMLGRGAEAGWPRWSADGRWLLFTAADRRTRRAAAYVLGLDQRTGDVTSPLREVDITGLDVDVFHAEWGDRGDSIVAVGKEAPGRHVIFSVAREGGAARVVHRFASEHDIPGIGVSPDGSAAAFIAPAPDGFFQVFRISLAGGAPVPVTHDPTNKTQPAWSPDGRRIAFTVWSYEAQFWRMDAPGR